MESDEHFPTNLTTDDVNFGDDDQNILTTASFEFSCLKPVDTNSRGLEEIPVQDPELVSDKQPLQLSLEEYPPDNPLVDPLGISEFDALAVVEDFSADTFLTNENADLDSLQISEPITKFPFEYPVIRLGLGEESRNSRFAESSLVNKIPDASSLIIEHVERTSEAAQDICTRELIKTNSNVSLSCEENIIETSTTTQEINSAYSIPVSSVVTETLDVSNQIEPSYCSKVFETEERLHDHEKDFHQISPEVLTDSHTFGADQLSRKCKEDLCKIVRERILRVSLEKIDTRTDTCEICGMSVLAVELTSHRRTHDEDEESSDSDSSSAPSSRARPKRSRPSSPAYLKTHSKREKNHGPPPSKTSVRLKLKVEAQTKPYQCRFCDKRFVSASQCRSHENAHAELLESSREESPPPVDTGTMGDASGRRRRGRPPKVRVEEGTVTTSDDQKSQFHTCDKCHSPRTECKCNTQVNKNAHVPDNIMNQTNETHLSSKMIIYSQDRLLVKDSNRKLQGMPILKPKVEPMDSGNSNSSLGPPELISAELEDRLLPKDTNESDSEKKETCQTCGDEFTRANLLDHIRSHLEKGQRNCSLCPYQGNNRNDLKEHINTHYGLRPYECRYCDKNFCWSTGLKRHMHVSHKDMTPFVCTHCPLRFETHRERRRHELTHKNILKPGGNNTSDGKPPRRSSFNPEKNSVKVPERSRSVAPSFPAPTTGLDSNTIAGNDDLEQELRKRSLYPIPEFAPAELRSSVNVSFIDFRNEIQPKIELNHNHASDPGNGLMTYGSGLQELTPTPDFVSFPTGNSNDFVKQEVELPISSGSFSGVQPSISNSSFVHNAAIQTPEYSASHFDGLSNDGLPSSPEQNIRKFQAADGDSPEMYHDKPDQRESEKCKSCNLNIPIDELMSHIQSHLRPLQKKCDICSYEATSWKLLPEHMNIHYVLKPFQCNICKRRFAMKGYLRSHHQQVHESADNRRYVCHFCDKRFVRPCHRKAHEKGVHLKEGEALPTPEMRKAALALGMKQSKEEKESKGKGKKKNKTSTPVQDVPISTTPASAASTNQPVDSTNPVPRQAYMPVPTHWSNSIPNNQTPDYHNQSHNQSSPHHSGQYQGQGHVEIKQENYWMQSQTHLQPEVQPQMHSAPLPSSSSSINQQPNHNWTNFHSATNEFDLKGPELNTNRYMNTHHGGQSQGQVHGQIQDFNYGRNVNEYNYHQGFSLAGMPPIQDYSYGVQNNTGWPDSQPDAGLLNPGSSVSMNYGSYPGNMNGDCDNNIIGSDARWSTADPYGILQTHNNNEQQQQQPVLHENTYTISRPADPVVDLWTELRHEELKLFPENGFGSYTQQSGSSLGLGMSQQQMQQGMVLDGSSVDGVPLIAPSRSLPLIPDLLESADGYTNGYFDGIPEISSDNMYEPNVEGIGNTFFDDMNDFTPDDSLSAPSGDDLDRASKIPCRTCGLKFLRADIIEHVRSHLTKGQKTCEICQHTFCSSMALRDHITTHYAQKPHQCLTCFKYFSTKHSLKNHIVCIHEGKREAKCQICNRAFTLVFSLRRHMRLVHKLNPKNGLKLAPSLTQPRGQSEKSKLKQQQMKEAKQAKLDETRVKLELEDERKEAEGEEERRNELHRRILERSWLVKLLDIGRNKIDCAVCQTSVMVKDLINHRWNHEDPCHICGKPVRIDEMLHHGVTHVISLYCEMCFWKARTRSQLYEHMNTHLGLKPIKCNICGAAFASRTSLRTHFLARHTKFRPHQCNYCPRRFVQLSVRRLHEMTHYGTTCPVCDQDFERKKDLVTHMKENHADEDPVPRMQSLNQL